MPSSKPCQVPSRRRCAPRGPHALAGTLLVLASILSGCATPTSRLRALAHDQGFARESVRAGGYEHTVFDNGAPAAGATLHVYLEGDGTPWRHRTVIMPDPTPRRPLMLALMALDDAASVYVGRPCYNGTYAEPGCDNRMWTSDRYSERVVSSMAEVVRRRAIGAGARRVRLFGHSGGAALALLIAERVEAVDAVVTLAGNLDTEAWTAHHGYSPLHGSINPARRPPLGLRVREWHLLGERDPVIPPGLVAGYLERRERAVAVRLPGFGHGCCWKGIWPRVLRALEEDAPETLPGVPLRPASASPAPPGPSGPPDVPGGAATQVDARAAASRAG